MRATEKLLNLLVTMRYLKLRTGAYRLRRHVRRWLLTDAGDSVRDAVLMKRLEWRWIEGLDSFVRDGRPLDVHGRMSPGPRGDGRSGGPSGRRRPHGRPRQAAYDLILMFSLVHHFDVATNRMLVEKSARALRPGGTLVIGEVIRPTSPAKGGQTGAFFDLYFALTSESGTWTFDEMASWQRGAGLTPRKPIRLRFTRQIGLQVPDRAAPSRTP